MGADERKNRPRRGLHTPQEEARHAMGRSATGSGGGGRPVHHSRPAAATNTHTPHNHHGHKRKAGYNDGSRRRRSRDPKRADHKHGQGRPGRNCHPGAQRHHQHIEGAGVQPRAGRRLEGMDERREQADHSQGLRAGEQDTVARGRSLLRGSTRQQAALHRALRQVQHHSRRHHVQHKHRCPRRQARHRAHRGVCGHKPGSLAGEAADAYRPNGHARRRRHTDRG